MSLFDTTTIECPNCETLSDHPAAGSVNADRRPDLRAEILSGTFQVLRCPSCSEEMRLEPLFNYLDVENGLWMAAYPDRQIGEFSVLEGAVQTLFDASYGGSATPSAQEVGELLKARLTFGWPAAQEKLLLATNGIDDVSIEMMKLDLMRRLPSAPLQPGVELRVVGVEDDTFDLVWIDAGSEEVLEEFAVERVLLTEIENNPEGWAALRESLTKGMFVDMQKLYLDSADTAA